MGKTWQVLKMNDHGQAFSVIFHEDDKRNPYWLYRHTWGARKNGLGYTEHKRIECKYADMTSCLYYLARAI